MTIDVTFVIVVGIILGFVLGYILASVSRKETECLGNIRIDNSADETYYFMEIKNEEDLNKISKSDYVSFKVVNENYIKKDR